MKVKIFTQLVLGIMFIAVPLSHAQNILIDGDFSTSTVITPYYGGVPPADIWCTWQNYSVSATAAVVDGVCSYQIYSVARSLYYCC